jgi:hypothetical protein
MYQARKNSKLFTSTSSPPHPVNPSRPLSSPTLCGGSGGDHAAVGSGSVVGSSADDAVDVVAIEVTSVDSVVCGPVLGVESAIGTERNTVLGEDVGSEEVAGLVLAVGVNDVLLVEGGLRLASGGAERGVVGVGVEEPHAVVGVVVPAVLLDKRSVDSSGKVGRSVEVGNGGGALAHGTVELGVTVGSSDDNVEVLAVLTLVGSRLFGDGVSVDGALDVGDRLRVGAVRAGLEAGVTFKEKVETVTELLAVAEGGTGRRVVRVEGLVGQVSNLLSRSGKVDEGLGVAFRNANGTSSSPELVLAVEVLLN